MRIFSLFLAALMLSLALPALGLAQDPAPVYVALTTSKGEIILELNPKAAPNTVDNFVKYVESGQYAGTIFHRVIKGFMIQGGGFDEKMNQKNVRPPIKNEADNGLTNDKYTLAMARTNDPHSATAQFFINTNNNTPLNFRAQTNDGWGYTVFGRVVRGQSVVDAIEKSKTGRLGRFDDVPAIPIVIEKAAILKNFPG